MGVFPLYVCVPLVFLMPAERVQKIRSPHRMHSEQIHTSPFLPLSLSSQPAQTITSYFEIPFKKRITSLPSWSSLCGSAGFETEVCSALPDLKQQQNNSPSLSSHQMLMSSQLVEELHSAFLPSNMGFCLAEACTGLMYDVISCVHLSCCIWKTLFLEVIPYLWLLQSFCPLFCRFPEP